MRNVATPEPAVAISKVTRLDLPDLLPLMRAYCDFYGAPRDDRLVALARSLIADPGEAFQYIARSRADAHSVGFATVYWTWSTLEAARIGVMYDLFVAEGERGAGAGRALIDPATTRRRWSARRTRRRTRPSRSVATASKRAASGSRGCGEWLSPVRARGRARRAHPSRGGGRSRGGRCGAPAPAAARGRCRSRARACPGR